MTRPLPPAPQVRKTTVETPRFSGADSRWSAVLALTVIDDRVAAWEAVQFVYGMRDGSEPFRFDASTLQEYLQDLAHRLHRHAGTWVKANAGKSV